ncbi:efflux RND transporter periplasmic adaptor subunit [Parvibaculum sp.]|uniref:efflux RND transporter periplasmic adaptor subunit n=1 Tax=Parvibaculum sp. TaxID=2024848 RepID=UPI00391A78AA
MGYESDTKNGASSGTLALATRLAATWRNFPAAVRWGSIAAIALIFYWIVSSLFFGGEKVSYRTVPATRGTIEQTVTALGSLQPKNYVDVGAQVSGQLKSVHVEVGDTVKQGDLLAEIDAKVYETEVAGARARLTDLESQLAGAEAELVLARRQYARNLDLAKIDAVSRDALDTSETSAKTVAARIGSLKAQIEQQKSTVEGGETNLGFTRIYAPIDGTVTAQQALQGQTLNANQTAPTIMTVSDLATMTVEAQVAEADVSKLEAGMPVYFTTLGAPERRWNSTVRQILPTPEIVNEVVLYTVLVDIANPDGRLMKDMTAQVFFVLGRSEDTIIVPVNAVTESRDGTARVSVMGERGPVEREVQLGLTNRMNAEILSGIEEGERVVTGVISGSAPASGAGGRTTRRMGFL